MFLAAVVNHHVYGIHGNVLKGVVTLRGRFEDTVPGVRIHEVSTRLKHKVWPVIHRSCAGLDMIEGGRGYGGRKGLME